MYKVEHKPYGDIVTAFTAANGNVDRAVELYLEAKLAAGLELVAVDYGAGAPRFFFATAGLAGSVPLTKADLDAALASFAVPPVEVSAGDLDAAFARYQATLDARENPVAPAPPPELPVARATLPDVLPKDEEPPPTVSTDGPIELPENDEPAK